LKPQHSFKLNTQEDKHSQKRQAGIATMDIDNN